MYIVLINTSNILIVHYIVLIVYCIILHGRYRWKKNFTPEILHFYWVVRHNEVGSFQWLIHSLTGNHTYMSHTILCYLSYYQSYHVLINVYVYACVSLQSWSMI
jgi:hypothetical protein